MATTRMSACRVMAARSGVRLWQSVTVASAPVPRWPSMIASGLPTMSLRPTITTCWPAIGMSFRTRSCCTPPGVQA